MNHYGPLVNGKLYVEGGQVIKLYSPIDNKEIAEVNYGDVALLELALNNLERSFAMTKALPSFDKDKILHSISKLLAENKDRLAALITQESAKPITAATMEIERAVNTFDIASEEAKRITGEIIPLDSMPGCSNRLAHYRYFPKGVVAGITPFNFPVNLVAHKIAPAIAAGCPIIIKPAPQTPLSAIELGLLILEAGWPKEALAIFPCQNNVAEKMICDKRVKFFSFTGSDQVGWHLKQLANKKSTTLELGGSAANIIHYDANLSNALDRIIWGGFVNAGQTCVSVQNVYLHENVFEKVKALLVEKIDKLNCGSPWKPETMVGPLISVDAAKKVSRLVMESVENGAQLLIGGRREGNYYQPTLLESNNDQLAIHQEEIFGPVLIISSYRNIEHLVERINHNRYGLQAGLFTNDYRVINYVSEHLQVGGLNINDVSTFRADHMPYGGIKDSGCGREGVYYAIREMMDRKLITTND